MAFKAKLIPLLLFLPLAQSCFAQQYAIWQTGFPSTATLSQFPVSVDVDAQGNAYLVRAIIQDNAPNGAGSSWHLFKISAGAKIAFDLPFYQNSASSGLQYAGVKVSAGTATVAPCITLFEDFLNFDTFASSIMVQQYDLSGNPLWHAPATIPAPSNDQITVDNFERYTMDVGADGTVYVPYTDINNRYLATVSHSGAVLSNIKTNYSYECLCQHLVGGGWLAQNIQSWSVINTAGQVLFSNPATQSGFTTYSSFARSLPNGDILSVQNVRVATQPATKFEHFYTLYSPAGVQISSSSTPETGVANYLFTDVTGQDIYSVGSELDASGQASALVELLSPSLAVKWHKDISQVNVNTMFADSSGFFDALSTYTTSGNTTTAAATISHYDLEGDLDWDKTYTPPTEYAQILCGASNGKQTYFTVDGSSYYSSTSETAYFDLVHLVRLATISPLLSHP